jgi:two-component system chemotaxis sensor kinase CheA
MSDNREFIEEFLVESGENLDQLDRDLLALEEQPDDPQRLASIFRTVHTIKGNSGFFGFSKLGALTHSGEHLLGRLRDGKLRLDDRVAGTLYSMVDAVRTILSSIEKTGVEGEQDFRDLSLQLAVVASATAAAAGPEAVAPVARPGDQAVAAGDTPVAAPAETTAGVAAPAAAEPPVAAATPPAVPAPVPPVPAPAAASPPPAAPPVTAPTPPRPAPPAEAPRAAAPAADTSIRVDVGLLESILDLVGELVLARNELRSVGGGDPALEGVIHRINAVTGSLQEAAIKTRMQPIEHVFNKFPRIVRDLAVSCGREVQLVIDGADTELDRTLIESIRDPLTHLIRNAVDHGIEPPATRESRGKPRAGRLSLRAFHESGQVTIEVQDDGAGIPVDAVRAKAVSRGLVDADTAASLPDERVLQFIFEPGFSTAAQVTSVSGRGVGMDVVKTNIEAIGGTVDLASRPGLGTTVRVRVPLTLAIIPALVVRCGEERFALPQAAVGELVPLKAAAGPRVEGLEGSAVIRVRGRLVPVIFLDEFLGLRPKTACREQGTVVLVRVDDHEFGLVVDAAHAAHGAGTAAEAASLSTIVVKPIGSLLAQLGIYSGATVLGDGGTVLILDLRGILRAADLPPAARHDAEAAVSAAPRDADSYLVCTTASGRRVALPLDHILRLEQFDAAAVERVGGGHVVRRGESFTPLVDADRLLGLPAAAAADGPVNVVVLGDRCGGVGVAVRSILDIAPAESLLQGDLAAAGVAGALAVGGRATEVLDLGEVAAFAAGRAAP